MGIRRDQVVKQSDGARLHRIFWDGLVQTDTPNNQFVQTLATFSTVELGKVRVVDDVFCGVDFQDNQAPSLALQLNVYDGNLGPEQLGDAQTPQYPQSYPLGVNQSGAINAGVSQKPWAWARVGQTLQVAIKRSVSTDVVPPNSNNNNIQGLTLQFRERLIDVIV